ncbi:hypothetical protein F4818DRAFT_289064 [Hypoxylon cercidicola]|nr:hypothetical protein F4818DRAFT_289064 [Hypoxylon cercidicola]
MNRLPETNTGVVTSWIPITTAHPTHPGCESLIWKYNPTVLAAWDPGYGVEVDTDATCLPKPVTTWWLQDRFGPIKETVLSIGPVTCPQDYYTATTSKKDDSSTYVACCPFDYSFAKFMGPGGTGQCTSVVKAGGIVTYAVRDGGWKTTSSSVSQATTAAAIPVNGWVFAAAAATESTTVSTTACPNSCDAAISEALANTIAADNSTCATSGSQISAGAAAGIGVGVSVGLTGLMALGAALLMMYRTRKAAHKRPPAAHIAEFANSGGKGTDTSAQVFPTYSPVPRETPSPSERPQYYQSYGRDAWDASTPCLPLPSQSDAHANARTVPHGEMEGMTCQAIDERTRRRAEIEGLPIQNTDNRSMGAGVMGIARQDSDGETRRRMELEGEFDRNVKVALTSPWVATARPVPPPSTSSQSQYHPPY